MGAQPVSTTWVSGWRRLLGGVRESFGVLLGLIVVLFLPVPIAAQGGPTSGAVVAGATGENPGGWYPSDALAPVSLAIIPFTQTLTSGMTGKIALMVSSSVPVDGVRVNLRYNPQVLTVQRVVPGPALPVVLLNDVAAGGTVRYAAGTWTGRPSGQFALATVEFTSRAVGRSEWNLEQLQVTANGQPVSYSSIAGADVKVAALQGPSSAGGASGPSGSSSAMSSGTGSATASMLPRGRRAVSPGTDGAPTGPGSRSLLPTGLNPVDPNTTVTVLPAEPAIAPARASR